MVKWLIRSWARSMSQTGSEQAQNSPMSTSQGRVCAGVCEEHVIATRRRRPCAFCRTARAIVHIQAHQMTSRIASGRRTDHEHGWDGHSPRRCLAEGRQSRPSARWRRHADRPTKGQSPQGRLQGPPASTSSSMHRIRRSHTSGRRDLEARGLAQTHHWSAGRSRLRAARHQRGIAAVGVAHHRHLFGVNQPARVAIARP